MTEDTGADAPGVLTLSGWPFNPYVFTACTVTDWVPAGMIIESIDPACPCGFTVIVVDVAVPCG
jgi:hypothetical protein